MLIDAFSSVDVVLRLRSAREWLHISPFKYSAPPRPTWARGCSCGRSRHGPLTSSHPTAPSVVWSRWWLGGTAAGQAGPQKKPTGIDRSMDRSVQEVVSSCMLRDGSVRVVGWTTVSLNYRGTCVGRQLGKGRLLECASGRPGAPEAQGSGFRLGVTFKSIKSDAASLSGCPR